MKRALGMIKFISSIAFFHILRELNKGPNKLENKGCKWKIRDLFINGIIRSSILP